MPLGSDLEHSVRNVYTSYKLIRRELAQTKAFGFSRACIKLYTEICLFASGNFKGFETNWVMPELHQGLTQIEQKKPLLDIVPIPVLNTALNDGIVVLTWQEVNKRMKKEIHS